MKYEAYELTASGDLKFFEFVSVGKRGAILKQVAFVSTEVPDVYNLSFGDIDENGEINDFSISDNGDRSKILATVVKAVKAYTEVYPDRWIQFEGSTMSRTRLYRMAISINITELSEMFEIFSEEIAGRLFLPFEKNIQASSFMLRRKIV